jgi:hypothetical protein
MMIPFAASAAQKKTDNVKTAEPSSVAAGKDDSTKDFEFGVSSSMVLYYFAIKSKMDSSDGDLDYSKASYRLKYKIDPVYMISFQGTARWKFLSFLGDYKTDRFIRRGGSIEQGDEVASKLTKNKTVSEILQFGIGIFDLKTSYRTVQFDSGTVYVIDNKTGERKASGQMKLGITDIDIHYDFHPLGKEYPLVISPGYKYMNYSVPRIVYRFEDTTPGETDTWEYKGETSPQQIKTKSHMGGFFIDFGPKSPSGRYALISGAGMYLGPNKTKFTLNGSEKAPTLFTITGNMKLGLSVLLVDSFVKANVHFMYELNVINTSSAETNKSVNGKYSESTVKYVFGSTDYYHGFSLGFDAAF